MRSTSAPSQRQLRVAELIRHALAEALTRGNFSDDVLARTVVTIPEVRLSPDLKIATVFVMPLGGKDGGKIVKALAQNAKQLRSLIARQMSLKFTPDLRFRLDETFDYADKIDTLLRKPEVSRDLENPLPGSDDESKT